MPRPPGPGDVISCADTDQSVSWSHLTTFYDQIFQQTAYTMNSVVNLKPLVGSS